MCRYIRENLKDRKRKYILKKRFKLIAAIIVMLTSAGFFVANKAALPATDAIFKDCKESSVTLTVSDHVYFNTQPIADYVDTNDQKSTVTEDIYDKGQ